MDRRSFGKNVAGAVLSGLSLGAAGESANVPADEKQKNVPYDISVMLWTVFRNLPFETRLEKVAAAGYKNVELVGEYANWSQAEFDRANAKRQALGITFDCTAGLKHSLCNPAERDDLIQELRQTIPIAEKLDCPAIILLSGNIVPGLSMEEQQQSCVEGLRAAANLIDGKKINGKALRLLLENIDQEENPKYFLTSVARGFEIIRAVGHPQVRFLYDFFHEQISEGNLIEKLEKNIEYVGLVHVADVPGRHEPGTGEINYRNIFRKLADLNYRNIVAMEFLPSGGPVSQLRDAREMALNADART